MGTGKENLNRTEIPIVPFQSLKELPEIIGTNLIRLRWSPASILCPQSFAIKIDRHAGNFGRHFNVWLLRKCGNWCSSVLFSCRPDTTKPCVTSESNNSNISSNKKTTLAQLFVAMSCDEKNNKRRKKRSKQSSETNSHVVPNSVENREVRSDV